MPLPPADTRGAPLFQAKSANRDGSRTEKEEIVLFQKFFKSAGPRTYAAQIQQARNGNHALILIEGKRDPDTNEIKKHKLYLWSEDFKPFFEMLTETVQWVRENPVPPAVKAERAAYWKKQNKR